MPGSTKAGKATAAPRNRPEQKFSAEGLTITIWVNEIETEQGSRLIRNLTLAPRRYRDRTSGEWRDGTSYRAADLHVLAFLIGKAIDYVYSTPLGRTGGQREPGDREPEQNGDDIPY